MALWDIYDKFQLVVYYIDYIHCNIYFRITAFDVFLQCFGRVQVISYMHQSRCFWRKLFLLNQHIDSVKRTSSSDKWWERERILSFWEARPIFRGGLVSFWRGMPRMIQDARSWFQRCFVDIYTRKLAKFYLIWKLAWKLTASHASPLQMMFGRLLSLWNGTFPYRRYWFCGV